MAAINYLWIFLLLVLGLSLRLGLVSEESAYHGPALVLMVSLAVPLLWSGYRNNGSVSASIKDMVLFIGAIAFLFYVAIWGAW